MRFMFPAHLISVVKDLFSGFLHLVLASLGGNWSAKLSPGVLHPHWIFELKIECPQAFPVGLQLELVGKGEKVREFEPDSRSQVPLCVPHQDQSVQMCVDLLALIVYILQPHVPARHPKITQQKHFRSAGASTFIWSMTILQKWWQKITRRVLKQVN